MMIKAVVFDMYETLITHYRTPLYFSEAMAADAGVDTERFRNTWRSLENDRTIGRITFEQTIECILRENNAYSEEMLKLISKKRRQTKDRCFETMHEGIIPMLEALKAKGIKIGLISNCFSEEAQAIKESVLFKYFDAACLSYELKMRKPEREIFDCCLKRLGVKADECLYIGDGGSGELEAAKAVGMKPLQAMWYSYDENNDVIERKESFTALDEPEDILRYV